MGENILNKLDEDFLFLLDFVSSFAHRIQHNEDMTRKCNEWLEKLSGEYFKTVDKKRVRNTYLSKLILCMQDAELKGIFLQSPPVSDLDGNIFEITSHVTTPSWLGTVNKDSSVEVLPGINEGTPARTYVATKHLPEGGICSYVAVSHSDDGPDCWRCMDGSGPFDFDQNFQNRFNNMCWSESNQEERLAGGQDQGIFLLKAVNEELRGNVAPGEEPHVNYMLQKLVSDLKDEDPLEYNRLKTLHPSEIRYSLLVMLRKQVLESHF